MAWFMPIREEGPKLKNLVFSKKLLEQVGCDDEETIL